MDMLVLTWPFCTMSIKNKYMHPLTKICHIWKYSSRRMPNVKHELLSIAWVPEFHLFFCKVRVAQFCFLCIALHICFPFLSFFFSFGHCIAFPSSSIYDSDYPFGILDSRLWLPLWYLRFTTDYPFGILDSRLWLTLWYLRFTTLITPLVS